MGSKIPSVWVILVCILLLKLLSSVEAGGRAIVQDLPDLKAGFL